MTGTWTGTDGVLSPLHLPPYFVSCIGYTPGSPGLKAAVLLRGIGEAVCGYSSCGVVLLTAMLVPLWPRASMSRALRRQHVVAVVSVILSTAALSSVVLGAVRVVASTH